MNYTALIEPEELARNLGASNLVVLDCRFDLANPASGGAAYARGHVPGAHYAHLDRDLSGAITPRSGRHPLPDAAHFEATVRRWGIGPGSQVITYDGGNGSIAARPWWMLRWLGHGRVAMLNGGWQEWTARGLPVSDAVPASASGTFRAHANRSLWVSTEEVIELRATATALLIDARSPERFAGKSESIDPVAGHIPDAVNHPLTLNVDARGRLLPPAELRSRWLRTLGSRTPGDTVAMCGSGVSACLNLLALEVAGLGGGRLYAGSWSEWIRDRGRPVATGSAG